MHQTKAYKRGFNDFSRQAVKINPYHEHTSEYWEWDKGWDDAREWEEIESHYGIIGEAGA